MVKRWIVGIYSAALVGGQRHVEYLVELGIAPERIFTGYDVVDNKYFQQKAEDLRRREPEVRQKYRLPKNYFLASARFIEKKNLLRLVRAYAQYRNSSPGIGVSDSDCIGRAHWDLVVLGDGPLREAVNAQLATLDLHQHVHLPGFKPYQELPAYYGLAKAFVHVSTTEQWGLVVNEAVASGLPLIVSNRCGCVPELVNGNGFTFDPFDEKELAERLLKMASLSNDERNTLSDASYTISANFGAERFGEGLEQAARVALNQPAKTTLIDRAFLIAISNVLPLQRSDQR